MFATLENWAATTPTDDFWTLSVFLVVIAVGCFIGTFTFLIRKRIIEDTPTSNIHSAAQGYIELIGRGESIQGELLQAPLTHTVCTWYRYRIEKRRNSGKRKSWVTIEHGNSVALFRLLDETGETLIDPEDAVVTPSIKQIWYGSTRQPRELPQKRKWYSLVSNRYRYTEERMHPGDPLYAIGLFSTGGGKQQQFKLDEEVRDLIREWKQDSDELLQQFDHNEDKQITMEEWQAVRAAAWNKVHARHDLLQSLPLTHMMGRTCDKRRPYLLSAVPEPDLIRRYRWYSCACLLSFLLSGPLAIWLIALRLAS